MLLKRLKQQEIQETKVWNFPKKNRQDKNSIFWKINQIGNVKTKIVSTHTAANKVEDKNILKGLSVHQTKHKSMIIYNVLVNRLLLTTSRKVFELICVRKLIDSGTWI